MQPDKKSSPTPNYDFILKDPVKPKASFGLPGFNLTRSGFRFGLLGLAVIVIIMLAFLLFGHKGSNSQPLIDMVARTEEISRVGNLVLQDAKDQDTKNLVQTAQVSVLSQQQQLVAYLQTAGTKTDPAKLTTYKNAAVDSQMQQAVQAGNLNSAYRSYLKTSLGAYQTALNNAYKSAGPKARLILNSAYLSNQTIIDSL